MVKIAVLKGDGIGPEIIDESARKVLDAARREAMDLKPDYTEVCGRCCL